ncbi:MAG TPA: NADH-quinone oxidoreductase subunit C [Polyangiales bacterium]
MSKRVLERLSAQFGERILETTDFRGDECAIVAADSWLEVARFLKTDRDCAMNQFTDLTVVDYPEREPELPRFDVVLHVRSLTQKYRIRIKTRVEEDRPLPSLIGVWAGADWAEREAFDMFGIKFEGHPDLRRILLYEEFVGYPLRKDYPIDRTQPLIPYREDAQFLAKLPPFGQDEGQPWTRINWKARLVGDDKQVSPAIALQQGQRSALSQSDPDSDASLKTPHEQAGE